MDELEQELKEGFLQESLELLEETEQAFLALENDPNNLDLLNKIFRFAHNLKGTSRAVGFGEVAQFTHELENLILKLKEGSVKATNEVVSLLLECNDHVGKMIHGLRENMESVFDHKDLIEKIQLSLTNKLISKTETLENSHLKNYSEDDYEIHSDAIPSASLFNMDEEFINESLSTSSPSELKLETENNSAAAFNDEGLSPAALESLRELGIDIDRVEPHPSFIQPSNKLVHKEVSPENSKNKPSENKKSDEVIAEPNSPAPALATENKKANTEETLRVSVSKVSKLNDLVGELVIVQTVLEQMRYKAIQNDLAIKAIGQLNKLSKEIQEMSMGLCLVPVKSTFQKMTRIVRDTSKALNKLVHLVIEGEETEIDRTVLEHLADPLVHIIRNAVDHGLESTEERIATGKKKEGTIKIRAYHEGNSLAIEVTDDGKGINAEVIRRKAIEKKIILPNANLSEKEIINLIFHAGFSTKDQVSEVSGRGVGMDVVKNNIQKVSGNVDIQTVVGKGSVFKITLPLTMAIIDGMIIQVGNECFVIPLDQIEESLIIKPDLITTFSGVGDCMNLRGKVYPLLKISQKLNLKEKVNVGSGQIAIIVNSRKHDYAVVVDDIIRQQQVVIKKIGDEVRQTKGLMGSTILGNGRPALILDLLQLFSAEEKNKITKTGSQLGVPTAA